VLDDLRSVLAKGKPITLSDLQGPKQEEYRVTDIEDGDPARSYQNVFGTYLATARSIRIIDPYVRLEFQVRNVEDLLASVRDPKGCQVELVTMYEKNDRYSLSEEVRSRERLDALKTRLGRKGFLFGYRFDPEIHDRMIETENWQIVLGRGLDFYYPPEPGQPARRARRCRIIYIPRTKAS
jgi:ATP-dependent Lon protease